MIEGFGPARQVKPAVALDYEQMTGKFIAAWLETGQPVTLMIDGNLTDRWVPIFETPAILYERMAALQIEGYKVQQIEDGFEFLNSIWEGGVRTCYNPRMEDGKAKWTEITPPRMRPIQVRVNGGPWLEGRVDMESNGKDLVVSVAEGIPFPFSLDPRTGRQLLFLMWVDGKAVDIMSDRGVEIRPPTAEA